MHCLCACAKGSKDQSGPTHAEVCVHRLPSRLQRLEVLGHGFKVYNHPERADFDERYFPARKDAHPIPISTPESVPAPGGRVDDVELDTDSTPTQPVDPIAPAPCVTPATPPPVIKKSRSASISSSGSSSSSSASSSSSTPAQLSPPVPSISSPPVRR